MMGCSVHLLSRSHKFHGRPIMCTDFENEDGCLPATAGVSGILGLASLIALIVVGCIVVPEYWASKDYEPGVCQLTSISTSHWKECLKCTSESEPGHQRAYIEYYRYCPQFFTLRGTLFLRQSIEGLCKVTST